ncbi:MAG: protein kinase [Deltaproteobacteria bacterium]|nr:protein kinase [Deltaproteobacteria bacterium]
MATRLVPPAAPESSRRWRSAPRHRLLAVEQLRRTGQLDLPEAARIVAQVAKALAAAHKVGIVHRDIKPDNIFLLNADDELFVKVLDFGIAKQVQLCAGRPELTATGMMLGTPYFMSPEMLLNPKGADARADLWALAAVAYRMVTGRLPFTGQTITATAMAVCEAKPAPPSSVRPGLPMEIDHWFERALCRDPQARFASAKELARAFGQAVGAGRPDVPADPSDSGGYDAVEPAPRPAPRGAPARPSAPAVAPGGSTLAQPLGIERGRTERREASGAHVEDDNSAAPEQATLPRLERASAPGPQASGAAPPPAPPVPWAPARTAVLGLHEAPGAPNEAAPGPWAPLPTQPLGEAPGDRSSQPGEAPSSGPGAGQRAERSVPTFSGASATLSDKPAAGARRALKALLAAAAAVVVATTGLLLMRASGPSAGAGSEPAGIRVPTAPVEPAREQARAHGGAASPEPARGRAAGGKPAPARSGQDGEQPAPSAAAAASSGADSGKPGQPAPPMPTGGIAREPPWPASQHAGAASSKPGAAKPGKVPTPKSTAGPDDLLIER